MSGEREFQGYGATEFIAYGWGVGSHGLGGGCIGGKNIFRVAQMGDVSIGG